jgi:TM2 domain-containing membrane protein YozV
METATQTSQPTATTTGYQGPDKVVLALICFFLGSLGVHRFIVGKVGTGILMILTLGGLGLWVLIDFIMILVGSFTDKQGNRIG